jgi:5-methylcytosine-specific restriction endonuclease McrA
MKNQRLSKKEQNFLKGAVRRVFSRSDLRRSVVEASRIEHHDPSRPRVTKWSRCSACLQPTPTYLIEVDHRDPIIPTDRTLDDMTWDDLVDRVWCDPANLHPVCKPCHREKTKAENRLRPRAPRKPKKSA